MDARGGRWIQAHKDAMQIHRPMHVRFSRQALTKVSGPLGTGKEALEQGAKIEAGAPGNDGQFAPGADGRDDDTRGAGVVAGGVEGIRGDNIEQVMRYLPPLRGGGLGRTDLQTLIDRDRIATDNLSVELLRQGNGERGFATSSRTQDHDQQG